MITRDVIEVYSNFNFLIFENLNIDFPLFKLSQVSIFQVFIVIQYQNTNMNNILIHHWHNL